MRTKKYKYFLYEEAGREDYCLIFRLLDGLFCDYYDSYFDKNCLLKDEYPYQWDRWVEAEFNCLGERKFIRRITEREIVLIIGS